MKRPLVILLLTALVLAGLAALAGSLRYGGPAGLVQRLRAEIVAQQPLPHPVTVPTPLPTPTSLASPTARPSPTMVQPTATPTRVRPVATATPFPSPSPAFTPTPSVLALTGLTHAWQTWNNCGPATLSTYLSYYGSTLTQEDTRQALRPNGEDKNVNPDELAAYARSQGYRAFVGVNGSAELLRQLLNNGQPVLVETWLEQHPNDGMGHYRLITGYDDARGEWIAYDSYVSDGVKKDEPYQGVRLPYDETADLWKVFNRLYLVIYREEDAARVEAILGDAVSAEAMWQQSLAQAQSEIDLNTSDAFAWFNLGSSQTALGQYVEAAASFDQARQIGLPWRMLWYQFGPFRAYAETGRWQEVLALADATLATTPYIEELHYWRAGALEALGDAEAAQVSFARAREINPNFAP